MIVIRGIPARYVERVTRNQQCEVCLHPTLTVVRLYTDEDLHKLVATSSSCPCGHDIPWTDENGAPATLVFVNRSAKNIVDDSESPPIV